MSLSEPAEVDSGEVEDFRLPDLKYAREDPPGRAFPFKAWDYGGAAADGDPPDQGGPTTAEDILAAARLQAQEIEQQAYEEGFQQGLQDGQEVGRRALEEVVKRLQDLAAALEQERENLFRTREKLLLELVILISEKLVARELSLYPEAIRNIIEEGFRHLSRQEGLRLLVSPPDYDILSQQNLDSWPPGVELRPDGSVTPGGFRLETDLGEVDGTRETRWALVVQAVQQAVEAAYAQRDD